MKVTDQEFLDSMIANNQSSYGARIVDYAQTWAELMEHAIADGKTVAECANDTSRVADTDGITGFMYGCAVSILVRCWEHGEELRRWNNLDLQIRTEGERANETGGVLNPALLNITL